MNVALSALTLGVVGHVDHGKTALVRALTGIETDRLKEERERGLSIVLGFAFLETPQGIVDLIDAPGHEDFIRAMIGGATALDGIVLCVAANEGVMPQTVEHFNIARLLGVERGFIVITKTDLTDVEALATVRADLERRVRGTFLEGAPVLEVSTASGAGIEAVREVLTRMASVPVERATHGRFFMPLDRVFTVRGFGLVVTGTLRGGELRVGDAVEILPAGKSATVRALENHNQPVERAAPGQRVAVNLRHLSRDDVRRGEVLAAPGSVEPTRRLDAELRLLEDAERPLANGTAVRFLTGTSEAIARLRLLDRRELEPGESGLAQLSLDRDVATRPSERFLIRSYSPMRTIGGGRILDINAKRHRRFDASVKERLEIAASGDVARIVRQRLQEAGAAGVDLAALAEELGSRGEGGGSRRHPFEPGRGALESRRDSLASEPEALESGPGVLDSGPQALESGAQALEKVVARLGGIRIGGDRAVASEAYGALLSDIIDVLGRFHHEYPLRTGLDSGSLANALRSRANPVVVQHALRQLIDQRKIECTGELFRAAGYDPFARLDERERRLVGEIELAFRAAGLEPPSPETIVGSSKAKQVIYGLLLETGRLVRLKTYDRSLKIVLHASILEDVKRAIASKFPYPQPFAVKDVRDLLRSSRRHVVPLLEHLDATGTTVRSGDLRRLRVSTPVPRMVGGEEQDRAPGGAT